MALEQFQIINAINDIINKEFEKRKNDSNYRMFFSEVDLINQLNATSDEDIKNIRICASTSIDTHNYLSKPEFQIETDINDYEMARARAFRKQELEPNLGINRRTGCLGAVMFIVIFIFILVIFLF